MLNYFQIKYFDVDTHEAFDSESVYFISECQGPLKENSIKNEKWKKKLRIRKLDVNMIWDHDRYVKASPGSTLQSSLGGPGMVFWKR